MKILKNNNKNSDNNKSLLAELEALKAALEAAKAEKAALESRLNASKNRAVKAPSAYDVLQPISVAIRGNIGSGIVPDITLVAMHTDICNALQISETRELGEKIFTKTVLHNSLSNLAKAKDINAIEGREKAFNSMLDQGRVLYGLDQDFVDKCKAAFEEKKAAVLKALNKA